MKKTLSLLIVMLITPWLAFGDPVSERLENSPRHHEWVKIPSGGRDLWLFVVYPEVDHKTTAVIVIHENRGLNDWARSAADQVAEAGFIAIAPDLLSGKGPDGGKTSDFPTTDAARNAIYQLEPKQVTADLNAAADFSKRLPASNRKVAVAGFCWGGSQTFRFATNRSDLEVACVFYGTGPEEGYERIQCPVYGFYGGNDERVNGTIPKAKEKMKDLEKEYDSIIYPGAGHGFMRAGEYSSDDSDPNRIAMQASWKRWRALLERTQ